MHYTFYKILDYCFLGQCIERQAFNATDGIVHVQREAEARLRRGIQMAGSIFIINKRRKNEIKKKNISKFNLQKKIKCLYNISVFFLVSCFLLFFEVIYEIVFPKYIQYTQKPANDLVFLKVKRIFHLIV
jgi:hypothetical protein